MDPGFLLFGAERLVERDRLRGGRCSELLSQHVRQLLVVPQRLARFALGHLGAHKPAVRFLQEPVVGDGLAVDLRSLRVALPRREQPAQQEQRLPVRPPQLLLALQRPFARREVFYKIARVEAGRFPQV